MPLGATDERARTGSVPVDRNRIVHALACRVIKLVQFFFSWTWLRLAHPLRGKRVRVSLRCSGTPPRASVGRGSQWRAQSLTDPWSKGGMFWKGMRKWCAGLHGGGGVVVVVSGGVSGFIGQACLRPPPAYKWQRVFVVVAWFGVDGVFKI